MNPEERPDINVVLSMLEEVQARLAIVSQQPDHLQAASRQGQQDIPVQADSSSYTIGTRENIDHPAAHEDGYPAMTSCNAPSRIGVVRSDGSRTAQRVRVSHGQDAQPSFSQESAIMSPNVPETSSLISTDAPLRNNRSMWPAASRDEGPLSSHASEGEDWAKFGEMPPNGMSSPAAKPSTVPADASTVPRMSGEGSAHSKPNVGPSTRENVEGKPGTIVRSACQEVAAVLQASMLCNPTTHCSSH